MIQTLTEYLYEAVANRSVGKYAHENSIHGINDINIGEKVRIKSLDELKEVQRGNGGVIVNPQMYKYAGNIVTIKRVYKDNSVSVIENGWYWPILALERI